MSEYPPARPWKNRPPRTGPRAGGRRTGQYGRQWGTSVHFRGNGVEIVNPLYYAVYVGGPNGRQARAMRARGWKSISDVAPRLRRKWPPLLIRYIRGGR